MPDHMRQSPLASPASSSSSVRSANDNNDVGVRQPRDPLDETKMQQERLVPSHQQQRQQQQQQQQQPRRSSLQPGNISQQPNTPSNSTSLNNNNINGNRGLGSSISFGSRSGEDMTYEEYSSYFDTP